MISSVLKTSGQKLSVTFDSSFSLVPLQQLITPSWHFLPRNAAQWLPFFSQGHRLTYFTHCLLRSSPRHLYLPASPHPQTSLLRNTACFTELPVTDRTRAQFPGRGIQGLFSTTGHSPPFRFLLPLLRSGTFFFSTMSYSEHTNNPSRSEQSKATWASFR